MVMLTGQSCWALVAQALLVDYICVQKCLSFMAAVASLSGPTVSPRTGR
jgi:hypothetical protein